MNGAESVRTTARAPDGEVPARRRRSSGPTVAFLQVVEEGEVVAAGLRVEEEFG